MENPDQKNDKENIDGERNPRKRQRSPQKWKMNIAQQKRNRGEEYKSYKSGKLMPTRACKPEHTCRFKCYAVLNQNGVDAVARQMLFSDFRAMPRSAKLLIIGRVAQSVIRRGNPKLSKRRIELPPFIGGFLLVVLLEHKCAGKLCAIFLEWGERV